MCVIAAKYFKDTGWVAGKNRDRNYQAEIHIKQSFRNNIERCLLWDKKTKWTEGINEFGVAILNTTLLVKKDEKEGSKKDKPVNFYSPNGKNIRIALYKKTPRGALQSLIEQEAEGFSFIFTKDEAYLLEAPLTKDNKYVYKFIKLEKDKTYVRTNHGILFPDAGYPKKSDDPHMVNSRKSSESRYNIVHKEIKNAKQPMDIFKILSQRPEKDPQMNPIRIAKTHGKTIMCTTGQILLVPSTVTMHYRPVWCTTLFNFDKLNSVDTKTYFEIVSSRELASDPTKESVGSFKQFIS